MPGASGSSAVAANGTICGSLIELASKAREHHPREHAKPCVRDHARDDVRQDLRRRPARRAPERRGDARPPARAELCERLAAAGLPRVEAASFVHPQRVPQMAGAEEVLAALARRDGIVWAALVLNAKGLERALAAGAREIHVAYPVTDSFATRNQNTTARRRRRPRPRDRRRARGAASRHRDARRPRSAARSRAGSIPASWSPRPGGGRRRCRRAHAGRHGRRRRAGPGARADARRGRRRRPAGRPAPAQHPQHRLRQRLAGLEEGATVFDASVGGLGGCPFAPARPATSPRRTSSTCSTARGWTPGSTSRASSRSRSGWARGSATSCPGSCTAPGRCP